MVSHTPLNPGTLTKNLFINRESPTMFPGRSLIALMLAAGTTFFSSSVFAGRPLVVDDASPVAPDYLQLELSLSGGRPQPGGRELEWPVIGVKYGLYPNLEVGMAIQRVESDSSTEPSVKGFEDLHLTTKYRIVKESHLLPALAVALDIKLPTANPKKNLSTGKSDQSFLLITTKSVSSIFVHLNVGYTVVRSPSEEKLNNRIFGGIAGEWSFFPRWSIVGEVFGLSREMKGRQNEADFQVGFKYALTSSLAIDTAAGRSLRSVGNSVRGTVGLTWTIEPILRSRSLLR